jgi:hypothetical protein
MHRKMNNFPGFVFPQGTFFLYFTLFLQRPVLKVFWTPLCPVFITEKNSVTWLNVPRGGYSMFAIFTSQNLRETSACIPPFVDTPVRVVFSELPLQQEGILCILFFCDSLFGRKLQMYVFGHLRAQYSIEKEVDNISRALFRKRNFVIFPCC